MITMASVAAFASASDEPAFTIDVTAGILTLVTLTTVLVLGLATLARPSRATVVWGVAYLVGLLGVVAWYGAQRMEATALQAFAAGLMLSFVPFVWTGLRHFTGRRPHTWVSVAFVVVVPLALALASLTPAFSLVFRLVFVGSSAFAALNAWELMRDRSMRRDLVFPLALVSALHVIFAVGGLIVGFFDPQGFVGDEYLGVLRDVNGVGTMLTGVCAAFTLVLMARVGPVGAGGGGAGWGAFFGGGGGGGRAAEGAAGGTSGVGVGPGTGPGDLRMRTDVGARVRARIAQAAIKRDKAWSVLDIRLDDPDDLRLAWPGATYASIVERFHTTIVESLPATADIERVSDERVLVAIAGSRESVTHYVRRVLGRISTISVEGPLAGLRLSASIGWSSVGTEGWEPDALIASASRGAELAREAGGDRWERMKEPV